MIRPPPRSPPFPYTALFRSDRLVDVGRADRLAQEALGLRVGHRDLLAQRDRRGLVRDAEAEQLRSEEHTSELQSRQYLVCRLLLEKKIKFHARAQRPGPSAV